MVERDPDPATEERRERARALWSAVLTGNTEVLDRRLRFFRQVLKRLPTDPRCRICNAPFSGLGLPVARLFGFHGGMSSMNPNICGSCEWVVRERELGVEVELSLLFADVRGSTALAERVGPTAFHDIIDRFYRVSSRALVEADALIDKLVGDEVIGVFVPGVAGQHHPRRAFDAARALLTATGHGSEDGPWLSIGAAVHSGTAYVGSVGSSESVSQITVLGDVANTTARLASAAGPGEILVSEDASRLGALSLGDAERRVLELRGRSSSTAVRVVRVSP